MTTQSEQAGPKADWDIPTPGHVLRRFADTIDLVRQELVTVRSRMIDYTRPVDEYIPGTGNTTPDTAGWPSPILLKPDFDTVDEMITGLIVVTPIAATNVILELGDRVFPLNAGIASLPNPVSIILGKTDIRQLTWSGGGNGWLELMGFAYGAGG